MSKNILPQSIIEDIIKKSSFKLKSKLLGINVRWFKTVIYCEPELSPMRFMFEFVMKDIKGPDMKKFLDPYIVHFSVKDLSIWTSIIGRTDIFENVLKDLFTHEDWKQYNHPHFKHAIRMGNIEYLQHFNDKYFMTRSFVEGDLWRDLCEHLLEFAAENGKLDCLKYLGSYLNDSSELDFISPMINAVRNGHLECLKYLHEIGFPWTYEITHEAYIEDQWECFKYACDNGCPCDDHTMDMIIMYPPNSDIFRHLPYDIKKILSKIPDDWNKWVDDGLVRGLWDKESEKDRLIESYLYILKDFITKPIEMFRELEEVVDQSKKRMNEILDKNGLLGGGSGGGRKKRKLGVE